MRMGPSLGVTRGGAAAFSPALAFAGGVAGAWYDFADPATLFQDAARTAPVTASGQTVGGVADKSGNGNHLSQGTASRRPVFTVSGGRAWLQFDGIDDRLDCAALAANWTGTVYAYAGVRAPNGGLAWAVSNIAGGTLHLLATMAAAPGQQLYHARSASAFFTPPSGLIGNADYVLAAVSNGAASQLEVNAESSGTLNAGTSTVSDLRIGARPDGLQLHSGRIYGVAIVAAAQPASQHAAMKTWMGQKSGVSL